MEKDRKAIIVKEINYWREHQLLPVQYCDFLLALYTKGKGSNITEDYKKQTPYYLLYYFFNTILLLFPPLIIQTIHNLWVQTIAIIIILTVSLLMIKLFVNHQLLNDSYAIMIFLLCCLFSSTIYIHNYISVLWLTYLWILLNGVIWILFGMRKKYFFVKVAGAFILIILAITYGFRIF